MFFLASRIQGTSWLHIHLNPIIHTAHHSPARKATAATQGSVQKNKSTNDLGATSANEEHELGRSQPPHCISCIRRSPLFTPTNQRNTRLKITSSQCHYHIQSPTSEEENSKHTKSRSHISKKINN